MAARRRSAVSALAEARQAFALCMSRARRSGWYRLSLAARPMHTRASVRRLFIVLWVLAPGLIASRPSPSPSLTLWAWERPEDLRFLPPGVGVAYLASTVTLGRHVSIHPRAQPLRVPDHVTPRPVVRIELRPGASLSHLDSPSREVLISELLRASRGGPSLQIDFDAGASDTQAYRSLLTELRDRAPKVRLSITGLASWCVEGSFLEQLPVDEVVPQLFRMGPDAPLFRARAESFPARCRSSVGLSVDESLSAPPSAVTVYLFNPSPWTAVAFARAREEILR